MRFLYALLIVLGALVLTGADASAQDKTATLRLPVRADSRVWLEGSSNVRDYFGIVPPRPWFGALRTADKVLIQLEIFVSPQALASAQRTAAAQNLPGTPPQ